MKAWNEMKETATELIAAAIDEVTYSIDDYQEEKTDENWEYVCSRKEQVDLLIFAYRNVDLITEEEADLYYRYTNALVRGVE